MDSYIAYHHLDYPQTVYFTLDHRYQQEEIGAIEKTIPQTAIVSKMLVVGRFEEPDANIVSRNLLLLTLAASYFVQAKRATLYLVVQKGEMEIPDRRPEFLSRAQRILGDLTGKDITIATPFSEMTKTEMVKWYIDVKLPVSELLKTHACYHPKGGIPCRECAACFRRWVAFRNNGIREFGALDNEILYWKGVDEYILRIADGVYDIHRAGETIKAIKDASLELDPSDKRFEEIRKLIRTKLSSEFHK